MEPTADARAARLALIRTTPPQVLQPQHCEGARLFSSRYEMMARVELPRAPVVTEVGVGVGDFSAFLLEQLQPRLFNAIDIFRMHEIDDFWGVPRRQIMGDRTHAEFFRHRFATLGDRMRIYEGDSRVCMELLEDGSQDLIYIDANHDLEPVRAEAEIATRKIKNEGVVIFNDYIVYDHLIRIPYGVVQAVNELVLTGQWRIVGFALHHSMFCDIAIRRAPTQRGGPPGTVSRMTDALPAVPQ